MAVNQAYQADKLAKGSEVQKATVTLILVTDDFVRTVKPDAVPVVWWDGKRWKSIAADDAENQTYKPITDDLCRRTASEDEVEHVLDWMVGHCETDDMLAHFKRICRRYWVLYPEMIEKEAREGGSGFWGAGFYER